MLVDPVMHHVRAAGELGSVVEQLALGVAAHTDHVASPTHGAKSQVEQPQGRAFGVPLAPRAGGAAMRGHDGAVGRKKQGQVRVRVVHDVVNIGFDAPERQRIAHPTREIEAQGSERGCSAVGHRDPQIRP